MPEDMDVSQSAAEKFSALLRPIKDAALAFDVDVNEALEEYVEECVRYVVADSDDVINFAEAGLLLQGSALVFGRKVDGLHALVYKVLENLKTGKAGAAKAAAGGGDGDGDDGEADDAPASGEDEFGRRYDAGPLLRIDDVAPGKHVDLDAAKERKARAAGGRPTDPLAALLFRDAEEDAPFFGAAFGNDGGLYLPGLTVAAAPADADGAAADAAAGAPCSPAGDAASFSGGFDDADFGGFDDAGGHAMDVDDDLGVAHQHGGAPQVAPARVAPRADPPADPPADPRPLAAPRRRDPEESAGTRRWTRSRRTRGRGRCGAARRGARRRPRRPRPRPRRLRRSRRSRRCARARRRRRRRGSGSGARRRSRRPRPSARRPRATRWPWTRSRFRNSRASSRARVARAAARPRGPTATTTSTTPGRRAASRASSRTRRI